MKHLIAPVSAVALMAGLAACSGADPAMDRADTDTAAYTDPAPSETELSTETQLARPAYVMAAGEMKASSLIGNNIIGADSEAIAVVADMLIGTNEAPVQIVFRDGGFLGIAGELGTLPFSSVSLSMDTDGEPVISAALVDQSLEGLAGFEQDGMNDFRLASELIGTNAELFVADSYSRITDLIISSDGFVNQAVVTDGVSGIVSADRLVIDFDAITVVQGDSGGEVMINKTPEQLKMAPVLID